MNFFYKLLTLALLLFVFQPAISQVRDGQVVSRAVPLGEGRSVPLPPGKWLVKTYPLPSNMASSTAYFLQNEDANSEIPLIFVNETFLYANTWAQSVYVPISNSFLIEQYGTTSSSNETKISSATPMNLKRAKNFFENFKFELDLNISEKNLDGYLSDEFLILDSRIINNKNRIRVVSLVRTKSQLDANVAPPGSQAYEIVKDWNKRSIDALYSSYNRKSPSPISYVFNTKQENNENQLALNEERIKLEKEKNNTLESENKKLEQLRIAQLEKEKQEAANKEYQLEAQRLVAESKVREQLRLAQLEKELQERRRIQEAQKIEAENKIREQARLSNQSVKKALVLGNNNYANISSLAMAVSDSVSMSSRLKGLGYRVTTVNNGNRKQMLSSVRQFKESLSASDEVILYYAGHGVQIGQSNYLLPIDIAGESEDHIRDEALALDRVLEDFNEKNVKFTLAIIDACRDNPFKTVAKRSIGGTRGLAPANSANGQIIIFSAGVGQTALDNLGPTDREKNGVFTRVLLDEMNKSNESIDRMIRSVRKRVVDLAKSVGHTQVPAIYDQAIGEFYFSK